MIHKSTHKLETITALLASVPATGRRFVAVATVEQEPSRDSTVSRVIAPGAVRVDRVPFPLLYSHDPDSVIGRVDKFYRLTDADATTALRAIQESSELLSPGETWIAEGVFAPNSAQYEQLVAGRFMRGVSVGAGQARGIIDDNELDLFELGPELDVTFTDFQVVELSLTSKQAVGPSVIWFPDDDFVDPATVQYGQPEQAALVASGVLTRQNDFATYPDPSWFTTEGLPAELPEFNVIDESGRFFGWLGRFDIPHVGFGSQKIYMPRENGHTRFQTKSTLTSADTLVRTGVICMNTKHSDVRLPADEAQMLYDNTGYAVADVAVVDVGAGYVLCGAVRPTVSEESIRVLRGSSQSGDWRYVHGEGQRRLYAIMACNTQGFHVRSDFAAESELALVASFNPVPSSDAALELETEILVRL